MRLTTLVPFQAKVIVVNYDCACAISGALRERTSRFAIGAIKQRNGTISLKYDGPAWLRKIVRDETYFWNPLAVRFQPIDPITDDELRNVMPFLMSFQDPYYLDFQKSQITNDGLKHLLPLADKLTALDIRGTAISDDVLLSSSNYRI
jgi:hypothetical protein